MSEQTDHGNERAERIATLRAELDSLESESSSEVAEVIEEAVVEVEEIVDEVVEDVVEVIEEETGETLTPDDVRILKGLIAAQASEEIAPEVNVIPPPEPEQVAEAVVDEPDIAPARTHWSEKALFTRNH